MKHLKNIHGMQAEFRNPAIPQAIFYLLNESKSLILSTETGSGKSSLLEICSEISGKIIVYCPLFQVLTTQMVNFAAVNTHRFKFNTPVPIETRILIISCEQIVSPEFMGYLNMNKENIQAIVIDECHEILMAPYRPIMTQLWKPLKYSIPVVLMSATLTAKEIESLKEYFSTDFKVFKCLNSRKNISYHYHSSTTGKTRLK